MQPKRDPDDRRYWPVAMGGTGHGFTGAPRETHPRRYAVLARSRDRLTMALPSIDAVRTSATPDAIRLRARVVLDLAMDRVERIITDDDNELRLNELAPTIAALGRISGVQLEEQKSGDIRIHIVRDTIATPSRQLLVESTPATLLYSRDDAHVIAPSSTPTDGVNDDAPTRYSDDW